MTQLCKVKFIPYDIEIEVEKETTLLNAAHKANVYLQNMCGGEGLCGRCRAILKNGDVDSDKSKFLNKDDESKGYVIACKTKILSDVIVEVPIESRLEDEQILVSEYDINDFNVSVSEHKSLDDRFDPNSFFNEGSLSKKVALDITLPDFGDNLNDLGRLIRQLNKQANVNAVFTTNKHIEKLGHLIRNPKSKVTALIAERDFGNEITAVMEGDETDKAYGIAVDIGTTTVVVQLVDLKTKEPIITRASSNKQIKFGEDVISRIIYSQQKDGMEDVVSAIRNTINSLLTNIYLTKGIKRNDITSAVFAGNTTMTHMFLGVDPKFIRLEPYTATADFFPIIKAEDIKIAIHPDAPVFCSPSVASYVGGDITSGVLATGIAFKDEINMLIDIGTNGEIVLGNSDWLVSCSCSAGPCFEGAGVKCGMRAAKGAIEKVEILDDYDITLDVIGETKPRGICGSGMIDLISEFLDANLINKAGKYNKEEVKTPRLRESVDGGYEFVLSFKKDSDADHDIVVTQSDIDNIIRAKGAIFSGIKVLIDKMSLSFSDVSHFYVAGGFGNNLNVRKSQKIGMLPDEDIKKFIFVGNTSLTGARMALIDRINRLALNETAQKMTYIELSLDNTFMDEFMSSLFIPHTDISLFPNYAKKE